MTSPIAAFVDSFSSRLEAYAPHDDGSKAPYRAIETSNVQGGAGQHRMFTWMPPLAFTWVRGAGASAPVVAFEVRLVLWLHKGSKSLLRFTLDVVEEVATLTRFYLSQPDSGWGSGGIESVVMLPGRFDEASGRLLVPFRVTSQEFAS